jgi:hypothetical protein
MELLNNLALGLSVAVSFQNLTYALLGCMLGTLIGVLPGIGPVLGTSGAPCCCRVAIRWSLSSGRSALAS